MLGGGIEMSRAVLYKIAAVALLVGAVLSAAGNLLAPQGDARSAVASGMYYPAAVAVLLGGLLIMAGWPAATCATAWRAASSAWRARRPCS
jgi:hypothetical protein